MLKLREASQPMSLSEISAATGMNKVTTFRFMTTLEQLHFVERVGVDRKFKIGLNAFYVGSGYLIGSDRERILEVMKRVVREFRHTITLSVLDGTSVLFLERLDGIDRVKVTVDIGTRVPGYASASGKAILAGLSDSAIRQKLTRVKFRRFTSNTRLSMKALLRDVREVRMRGFAINDEESDRGLWVIAVPIKDKTGGHVAALAAACPAHSLNSTEKEKLFGGLQSGAKEIETLGIVTWLQGAIVPSEELVRIA